METERQTDRKTSMLIYSEQSINCSKLKSKILKFDMCSWCSSTLTLQDFLYTLESDRTLNKWARLVNICVATYQWQCHQSWTQRQWHLFQVSLTVYTLPPSFPLRLYMKSAQNQSPHLCMEGIVCYHLGC